MWNKNEFSIGGRCIYNKEFTFKMTHFKRKNKITLNIKNAKCCKYYQCLIAQKIEKPSSIPFWEENGIDNEDIIMQSL